MITDSLLTGAYSEIRLGLIMHSLLFLPHDVQTVAYSGLFSGGGARYKIYMYTARIFWGSQPCKNFISFLSKRNFFFKLAYNLKILQF